MHPAIAALKEVIQPAAFDERRALLLAWADKYLVELGCDTRVSLVELRLMANPDHFLRFHETEARRRLAECLPVDVETKQEDVGDMAVRTTKYTALVLRTPLSDAPSAAPTPKP